MTSERPANVRDDSHDVHSHRCRYCFAMWNCTLEHANGTNRANALVCHNCRRLPYRDLVDLVDQVEGKTR